MPKNILVRETGECAERRESQSIANDLQPYQPCEQPPINTLLVRKFASGEFGFYAKHSQFATTQSSCTTFGIGRLKSNAIVGAVSWFDKKEFSERCKVSLHWTLNKAKNFSKFEFRELSACSECVGTVA